MLISIDNITMYVVKLVYKRGGYKLYIFREDVENVYNQAALARKVGISVFTMNRIFNRKQKTSKTTAYCIAKAINPNAEIEDYFVLVKKGE